MKRNFESILKSLKLIYVDLVRKQNLMKDENGLNKSEEIVINLNIEYRSLKGQRLRDTINQSQLNLAWNMLRIE